MRFRKNAVPCAHLYGSHLLRIRISTLWIRRVAARVRLGRLAATADCLRSSPRSLNRERERPISCDWAGFLWTEPTAGSTRRKTGLTVPHPDGLLVPRDAQCAMLIAA